MNMDKNNFPEKGKYRTSVRAEFYKYCQLELNKIINKNESSA